MLWLDREYKREMREEDYEGGENDRIWLRARTNCLWLGDTRRDVGYVEQEKWRTFCTSFSSVLSWRRRVAFELQRPRVERRQEVVREYLFGEEGRRTKSEALTNMWRK